MANMGRFAHGRLVPTLATRHSPLGPWADCCRQVLATEQAKRTRRRASETVSRFDDVIRSKPGRKITFYVRGKARRFIGKVVVAPISPRLAVR